jgi:hypothetical protein
MAQMGKATYKFSELTVRQPELLISHLTPFLSAAALPQVSRNTTTTLCWLVYAMVLQSNVRRAD